MLLLLKLKATIPTETHFVTATSTMHVSRKKTQNLTGNRYHLYHIARYISIANHKRQLFSVCKQG